MKVINILGSPRRNGTSARIAASFVDAAQELDAVVDSFYLNGMRYRGCQGCERCHNKSDRCILDDDIKYVLESLYTADVALFSSPVYYGDTSGQFKKFFDRTWSLVRPNFMEDLANASRLPRGKTAVFILTQGDVAERHLDIVERYSEFLTLYGYDLHVIRATGLMSGAADADVSTAQTEAAEIAKKLLNNN